MTKNQIIKKVADITGTSKSKTKETIQVFLDVIIEEVKNEGEIKLKGFGNFKEKIVPGREIQNYKTKEKTKFPPRKIITFRQARSLSFLEKEYNNEKPK